MKRTAAITALAALVLSGCGALGKSEPAATVTVTQQPATAVEESKTTPAEKTTPATEKTTTVAEKPEETSTADSSSQTSAGDGAANPKIVKISEKGFAHYTAEPVKRTVTKTGGENMPMSEKWEGVFYYGDEYTDKTSKSERPKNWIGSMQPLKIRKTDDVHKGKPIWMILMSVDIQGVTSKKDIKIRPYPASYLGGGARFTVPGMRGVSGPTGGSECMAKKRYCVFVMGEEAPKLLQLNDAKRKLIGVSWKLDS